VSVLVDGSVLVIVIVVGSVLGSVLFDGSVFVDGSERVLERRRGLTSVSVQ